METTKPPPVHPGDLIQATAKDARLGHIYIVSQVKSWGVGAVQRWLDGPQDREAYHRLQHGEFAVIGAAAILPVELAQARADSLATAAIIDQEAKSCPSS